MYPNIKRSYFYINEETEDQRCEVTMKLHRATEAEKRSGITALFPQFYASIPSKP